MEWITNWLTSNSVLAWIGTIIVSIGAVGTLITKYGSKIRKAIKITNEVLDVVEAILAAADDKDITKEEIEIIAEQVAELQAVLK